MDTQNDEAELWLRARRNEGAAFAALFDLHHARVYARAHGLLGGTHDAEDTAAAAFFELWRKRQSVRLRSGSILLWLLVTTVNLSRNVRRALSGIANCFTTSRGVRPPPARTSRSRTLVIGSPRPLADWGPSMRPSSYSLSSKMSRSPKPRKRSA